MINLQDSTRIANRFSSRLFKNTITFMNVEKLIFYCACFIKQVIKSVSNKKISCLKFDSMISDKIFIKWIRHIAVKKRYEVKVQSRQ
jgi:hypothetical protein